MFLETFCHILAVFRLFHCVSGLQPLVGQVDHGLMTKSSKIHCKINQELNANVEFKQYLKNTSHKSIEEHLKVFSKGIFKNEIEQHIWKNKNEDQFHE